MEEYSIGIIGIACAGRRWIGGEGLGTKEEGTKVFLLISSGDETVVESTEMRNDVVFIGAKCVESVAVAEDKTGKNTGSVGGVWWDE